MPEVYKDGLGHALRATVLRPFTAVQRGAADRAGRYADAAALRAERDSLASFLVGQATLAAENRQLRQLLGFRERLTYSYVAAETTPTAGPGSAGTYRLSVGRGDGVQDGAPVITAEGLAGQVGQLGNESSTMLAWTHPDFAVSVMTVDGETYGVAEPLQSPSGGETMLGFSPVAFHTAPDTGTLIVTSGDGGVYPRGIPVGRVAASGKDPRGWQRIYYVRPLVSPAQLGHVLVLGPPVRAPSDQDLASAWGVRLTAPARADSAAPALSPDAATPAAPRTAPRTTTTTTRPAPRRPRPVDPTPELPGRPVFPGQPRVPEGLPAPSNPGGQGAARDTSRGA
ncbi:rod shape-determining protein MreC [Longimicrobium sp.]|uniref:rod shape-determining protein MreC n=1 Tax=Longimicrobium sp. TaxID=2029185 RepID=UPI002E30A858|nr:rod shape-determining protein MreC [Longimicrobium sp.]HEX6041137.1 rod shape-determining protein MreC [Longimicrobium sp.]